MQSANSDQKPLETHFKSKVILPIGDNTQSKSLFLTDFDPRRRLLNEFSIVACSITKTRPCNILQYLTAVKMIIFR